MIQNNNYDDILNLKKEIVDREIAIANFYIMKYVGKTLTVKPKVEGYGGRKVMVTSIRWGIEPVFRKEIICTIHCKIYAKGAGFLKGHHAFDEEKFEEFEDHYKTDYNGKPK